MPLRQRTQTALGSQHTDLKLELVQEWKNPQEIPGNPIIIEEQSSMNWLPYGSGPGRF
jgi:hypothetical protein